MTIKHLLIFLIANCSVFNVGVSSSNKTLLVKEGSSPINCQFLMVGSHSRSNKGVTHHLNIQTHLVDIATYVVDNVNTIFGNYLFDVVVIIKSGEYEKYVLTDDDNTNIISHKEIEWIQCTSCAWV